MSKPTEQLMELTNELDNLLKELKDAINQSQIDDSDKKVFIEKIRSISNLNWPLEDPGITETHQNTIHQTCSDIGDYFIEKGTFSEQDKIHPLLSDIECCRARVRTACQSLRDRR